MAAIDTETKTAPENHLSDEAAYEVNQRRCACHADQEELGRQLAQSSDPHVRIIAHMSNRQLALSEQLGDTTKLVFKTASGVASLQQHAETTTAELRRLGTAVEGLTAAVQQMTEAVGTLMKQQEDLSARTEELEDAAAMVAAQPT